MASVSDKMKGSNTAATPHEIVEKDHDNLHLSKDAFIAKYRKKKEIKAKLELERIRLEELAREEEKTLEQVGKEDLKPKKTIVTEE